MTFQNSNPKTTISNQRTVFKTIYITVSKVDKQNTHKRKIQNTRPTQSNELSSANKKKQSTLLCFHTSPKYPLLHLQAIERPNFFFSGFRMWRYQKPFSSRLWILQLGFDGRSPSRRSCREINFRGENWVSCEQSYRREPSWDSRL